MNAAHCKAVMFHKENQVCKVLNKGLIQLKVEDKLIGDEKEIFYDKQSCPTPTKITVK